MLDTNMRRAAPTILVIAMGVLATCSAVALAHNTPHSWTAAKAQVMLPETTTIALPQALRESLDAELEELLAKFRLLELTAQQERGDWLAAATYSNYVTRFRTAQDTVNGGLSIDAAKCVGTGKALSRKRYKHFRCTATSYILEVPSVELQPVVNGALPEVLEGPVRRFGPLEAVFTVHVTGKTRMLSQRAN